MSAAEAGDPNGSSRSPAPDGQTTPSLRLAAQRLYLPFGPQGSLAFLPIHHPPPVGRRVRLLVTRSQGVERGTSIKQFALRKGCAVAVAIPGFYCAMPGLVLVKGRIQIERHRRMP